ncbi:unnamed protein product [Fusarium graminearum]|nr:unnamed protein product [Fusarium graminearum]
MESQIFDWYSSLPLMFYFDTPQGYVAGFATDAMVYVLRHRYISFCELVSRPFVRLCVDRLVEEIDSSLHTTITSYASQWSRHQGTWYGVRAATSGSLILTAVDRAQRQAREDQIPRIVKSLTLPEIWRDGVRHGVRSLREYFNEPNGGCSNMKQVLGAVVLESPLD